MGGKHYVESHIGQSENNTRYGGRTHAVDNGPFGKMPGEFGIGLPGALKVNAVAFDGGFGHLKYVPEKVRRVRIFFGVAVGMVLAVHQGISPRIKKRGAFEKVGHQVKSPLPKLIGGEHAVRGVAVLKEGLKEQRQEPMRQEKNKYDH